MSWNRPIQISVSFYSKSKDIGRSNEHFWLILPNTLEQLETTLFLLVPALPISSSALDFIPGLPIVNLPRSHAGRTALSHLVN